MTVSETVSLERIAIALERIAAAAERVFPEDPGRGRRGGAPVPARPSGGPQRQPRLRAAASPAPSWEREQGE